MYSVDSAKGRSLLFVLLTVAIDTGGEAVVLPILGRLALNFGVTVGKVGTLFSGTAAAMVLSNVWLPMFADRFGRRNAMLVSLVGSTVGYGGQAVATSFGWLLAFRVVQGLFGGVPPVALAYVTDVFAPKERPEHLANIQATISSSFVFGAVIGGGLSRFGLRVPLIFSFVLSGLGLLAAWIHLLDPHELISLEEQQYIRAREQEDDLHQGKFLNGSARPYGTGAGDEASGSGVQLSPLIEEAEADPAGLFVEDGATAPPSEHSLLRRSSSSLAGPASADSPFRDPRALTVGLVSFLNNICFCGMSVLLPLYVAEPQWGLGKGAAQVAGFMFGFVGVTQAVVMTTMFHSARARCGLLLTCIGGSVLHGLGVMLLAACPKLGFMFIALCIAALGNGLCRPAYVTYLSLIASKSHVSQTLSLIDVTLNSAMVLGPQLTVVYEAHGFAAAFGIAGSAAIVQSLVVTMLRVTAPTKKDDDATAGSPKRGLPRDEFLADIQAMLVTVLEGRNYAIDQYSAQCVVREIIDRAFPFLRPGGPGNRDHMEDVFHLMKGIGREDEARDVQFRFGFTEISPFSPQRHTPVLPQLPGPAAGPGQPQLLKRAFSSPPVP